MYYNQAMHASFETEKNKKAFAYTAVIVAILVLLAIFITWPLIQPPPPLVEDLIEINLGNNIEGFGDVQPLIKGGMAPAQEQAPQTQNSLAAKVPPAEDIQPDENEDKDAAPVAKPEKVIPKANKVAEEPVTKPVKNTTPAPVVTPAPKPQKPKATYNGSTTGNGNGATEDNGYTYQGNKPGGKGDAGDPSGKPDSYGNNPGGRSGGPRVIGNRKIIKYYSFTGDLPKATIYATVKVSPDGVGTFKGFAKNSSSTNASYATSIQQYLGRIQFDKSSEESTVVVQFNFTEQ